MYSHIYGRIDRLEVRNIYLDVRNNCCARIAFFNLLIKKANNYLVQWKLFKPLLQFRETWCDIKYKFHDGGQSFAISFIYNV